jgi:Fur family ferric uptake transcriptional regulator
MHMKPPLQSDTQRDAWTQFAAFLRNRGDRLTPARRAVLSGAMQQRHHFQADELARELAQADRPVSRGTVYRTLALLVKAGLLCELRDRDTHVHYETVFGRSQHEHMICERCGAVVEFEDADLHEHITAACENQNFRPRQAHVTVFGVCQACNEDS